MKILFLDIDGVLCNEEVDWSFPKLGPKACAVLAELLERTGAKVVVSSTWRYPTSVTRTRELLGGPNRIDPRLIIGCTPSLELPRVRGDEIQAWLDRYADHHQVDGIAIVDDGENMAHLTPWLVRTGHRSGLTAAKAQQLERTLARPWPRTRSES